MKAKVLNLELGRGTEAEELLLVVGLFADRLREVHADRANRRRPEHAATDRRADRAVVSEVECRPVIDGCALGELARTEQRAGIGEHSTTQAEIIRKEREREANLRRNRPVGRATDGIV